MIFKGEIRGYFFTSRINLTQKRARQNYGSGSGLNYSFNVELQSQLTD